MQYHQIFLFNDWCKEHETIIVSNGVASTLGQGGQTITGYRRHT